MGAIEDRLLSVITFLPLGTAVALLLPNLLGRRLPEAAWRSLGLASTLVTLLLALVLFGRFDAAAGGYQFVEHVSWLPDYGIHYFVGVDGISLLLVLMTAFLMPLALAASWTDITRSVRSYVFFMLALETGMLGAFVSLNLFPFYVFWEAMLIPMYFIIGIWGGDRRVYAAIKFFLYTMVGSLLMLVAMLVVYYLYFEHFGHLNLDLVGGYGPHPTGLLDVPIPVGGEGSGVPWWRTQLWLFAAFALAFGIKVPVFPFHTWLPDAHVQAPTAGSVILAGVLLKMGTYGFVRFALPLFPVAAVEAVPLVFALALVGIVYGSLVAMVQSDVKKLVAYSSVAHLGFVMLGLFAFNAEGVEGSVLQMVNHGLSTGALFLLVGMIYERRHTRQIAEFGGLARVMPVYAALFGLVTMSSIGLPMLNGFVGEFLILLGAFLASPWAAVVAATGVILGAAYMLWMYRRVFFGPLENQANRGLLDLNLREKTVLVAMAVPIVWIGVHPETFLRPLRDPVAVVLERVQLAREEARPWRLGGALRSAAAPERAEPLPGGAR